MMKKHKKLLIVLLLVALLGGIYAYLILHPPADEEGNSMQTILSQEESDLSGVTVTPADSTTFTVSLQQDGESTLYTMDDKEHDYDDTQMSSLVGVICELSGYLVESDCENPDSYGLGQTPAGGSVSIERTDGSGFTVLLGKENTAIGGIYCRLSDSNEIYLLNQDASEQLTADLQSYRSLLVAGGYYDLYSDLDSLSISGSGRSTITIERRNTDDLREDAVNSYSEFVFIRPVSCAADDSAFSDGTLMQLQYALTAQSIAADDPSDLALYGLDDPVSIHIRTNNADVTVLVGNPDGNGGQYMMREGGNTVFVSDASNLSFLDTDWREWRSKDLLSFAQTELKSITLSDGDTLHSVVFTQTDEEDEDGNTERTTTATYNGEQMTEDAMDACYINYSSISFTEQLDSAPDGSPQYVIAVDLENGSRYTVQFVKYASRTYAANVDGSSEWFTVSQDTVTALLDSMTTGESD